MITDGGFQPAETEVESGRVAEKRPRQVDRGRIAFVGRSLDCRPAGKAEPQQTGHLVERFAGRVIDGST